MAIVGSQKFRDGTDDKKKKTNQGINLVEFKKAKPPEEVLAHQKNLQQEEQEIKKDREFYGITTFGSFLVCFSLLLLNTNPVTGFLFTLVLWFSSRKVNDSVRELARINQVKASERIEEILVGHFSGKEALIYSALQEPRLNTDKKSIDYLLTLSSGLQIAISVRSILPPMNESEFIKVYFDHHRKKLVYRKGKKNGKRTFNFDPIHQLKEGAMWLSQNQTDLLNQLPICIVVMAEPSLIDIYKKSPVQLLNSETYLCIEDVYVVEEKRLITLISSLNQLKTNKTKKNAQT